MDTDLWFFTLHTVLSLIHYSRASICTDGDNQLHRGLLLTYCHRIPNEREMLGVSSTSTQFLTCLLKWYSSHRIEKLVIIYKVCFIDALLLNVFGNLSTWWSCNVWENSLVLACSKDISISAYLHIYLSYQIYPSIIMYHLSTILCLSYIMHCLTTIYL